jgi:hypothetical protein
MRAEEHPDRTLDRPRLSSFSALPKTSHGAGSLRGMQRQRRSHDAKAAEFNPSLSCP